MKSWYNIKSLFRTLNGNALVMTMTSQLWVIPTAGLAIYQPVFFQSMGISVTVYGLLMSVQQLLQILYNFPGSWFAVRLGKKWANIAADFAGWVVGAILFAVATQGWQLVICLCIYNLWVVGNVAHECLLVDETESKYMMDLFTVRQWISSILPMVAVPLLSAYLMHRFGVMDGVRLQFVGLAGCVVIALVIRGKMLNEPRVDAPRAQNNLFRREVIRGLLTVFRETPSLRRSLVVSSLIQFAMVMTDTYFSIFALRIPGVSLGLLGLNAVVSGVMVWVATFILAQISHWREERLLFVGVALRILAWIPLFALFDFYGFILYMVLSSLGNSVISPSLTAWFANTTTEELRPTLYGVYNLATGTLLLGAPPLGGILLAHTGILGLCIAMVTLLSVMAVYLTRVLRIEAIASSFTDNDSPASDA